MVPTPRMLTPDEVMPLVLEACPSFRSTWDGEIEEENAPAQPGETRLCYLDAGAVAEHVAALVAHGEVSELPALMAVVERMHLEGDPYVAELATIGYLEDLQSCLRRADGPAEAPGPCERVVLDLLGPESRRWWRGLDAFWHGRAPRVMRDADWA